jgi:uncharacterized protein (TIGR02145 family)
MDFDYSRQATQKTSANCPDTVTDYDGNTYATVLIGNQCWFAENLKVQHHNDGKKVENSASLDIEKYGRLYRWASVADPSGLCPEGWHVPSDEEIQLLEKTIGMAPDTIKETGWRSTDKESRKLKKFDYAYSWSDEEKDKVNKYGFSLLPAGAYKSRWMKGADGIYSDLWTSTEFDKDKAWSRSLVWFALHPGNDDIRRNPVSKEWAFSVRCLKD